jgi:hypothetical protein
MLWSYSTSDRWRSFACPADTAGMAQTGTSTTWSIYKITAKAVLLGTVEAPDEPTAIEKAAEEFNQPANRLMAVRR